MVEIQKIYFDDETESNLRELLENVEIIRGAFNRLINKGEGFEPKKGRLPDRVYIEEFDFAYMTINDNEILIKGFVEPIIYPEYMVMPDGYEYRLKARK